MSETCLISVLMPVYDGEAYLGRALDSLRGQVTPPPFEVLAGDDGSTDGSPGLLRAAAETLPLRIFPGPGRGSWVANTNELLARAKGRYVTFLHQDDAYAPDRLARLAAAVAEHPDVPFFANDTRFIGPAGTVLGPWTPPLPDGFVSPADALEGMLVQNNFSVPAVLLRRDLIDELGPMDESLTYTADWDYWLRAMSRHGVYHLPHALSSFGIHAGSQTTTLAAKIEEMRRNLETVRDRFLPCACDLLPAARYRRLKRLARLSVESNLLLAALAAHVPLPWRPFLTALFACPPTDLPSFLRRTRLGQRIRARRRASLRIRSQTP